MSSDNPTGADNQQETERRARARSDVGRGLRGRRGLLLRLDPPQSARPAHPRLAAPSCSSRCTSTTDRVCSKRWWPSSAAVRSAPRARASSRPDLFGQGAGRPRGAGHPLLRAPPAGRQGTRLPSFATHRPIDAAEGAPDAGRVRATRAARLRHERQWQATSTHARGRTRGSSETVRQAPTAVRVKIQSDPHGDMRSSGRNDLAARQSKMSGSNNVPKVAKFLVG